MQIKKYIDKINFIRKIKEICPDKKQETNILLCYSYFENFDIVFSVGDFIYLVSKENKIYKTKYKTYQNNKEIYCEKNVDKIILFMWEKYCKIIENTKEIENLNKDFIVENKTETQKRPVKRIIPKSGEIQDKEEIEEEDKKTPLYKLQEFWKYDLNPITGFGTVVEKHNNNLKYNSEIYWIETNNNKTSSR